MKEKKSTKANYLWNLAFQVFLIIVPLITTPYVSRVLGSDGIGKFSFSSSIVYYFGLFAMVGFSYYAQREAAKYKEDKYNQSKIFWEIMILKSISTVLAVVAYLGLIFSNALKDYNTLLFIYTLNVISVLFDTTFIFQANDDFKNITLRNFIVRLIMVVLIFVLVRTPDDLWIYTLLNAGGTILSTLIMIPFLGKYIVRVKTKDLNIVKHIKPTLRLFIPTIAISIYVMLDKTMIGLMVPGETTVIVDGVEVVKKVSDLENGYYEQAEKIVKLVTTVITSLSIVMISKNVEFVQKHDEEGLKNNVYKAVRFTLMLGIPMTLGLICIATNFSPWFFGPGYEKVPYLIMILSIIVISIGLSGVFGIQYMVAVGRDKAFTIIVTSGAILNFVINLILVKYMYSYGVAISTAVVETLIAVADIIYLRKVLSIKRMIKDSYKYVISGAVMFGITFTLSYFIPSSVWGTLVLIGVGILTYALCILLLRDSFVKEVIAHVLGKVKRVLKKEEHNESSL